MAKQSDITVPNGPPPKAGSPPSFLIPKITIKDVKVVNVRDRKAARLITEAIALSCQKDDIVRKSNALIIKAIITLIIPCFNIYLFIFMSLPIIAKSLTKSVSI